MPNRLLRKRAKDVCVCVERPACGRQRCSAAVQKQDAVVYNRQNAGGHGLAGYGVRQSLQYKTRPGTSLLIALILTTILVMVALGSVEVIVGSARQVDARIRNAQAYHAASGALEEGLLEAGEKGIGYDNSDTAKDISESGSGITAKYRIYGRIKKQYDDKTYGIPAPGTGDAGSGCDDLKAYVTGTFYYKDGKYSADNPSPADTASSLKFNDAKDHPCNWNRIRPGETVSVPLYYTKGDGKIVNPADSPDFNLGGLKLKVRTPCYDSKKEGIVEMCDYTGRYNLDSLYGDKQFNGDDAIVLWAISGSSSDGKTTYNLTPNTYFLKISKKRTIPNSEIYESKINLAKNSTLPQYVVLSAKNNNGQDLISKKDDLIINFLKNSGNFFGNTLTKPVLKLTVIHSLKDMYSPSAIPHLEYQLNIESSNPPADINQRVIAEGYSGSYKQVLQANVPRATSLIDYVVQQ